MISETPSPVPMRNRALCLVTAALLSLAMATVALAQAHGQQQPRPQGPGTGNPDEHLVPWRFVEKDSVIESRPLTLYWLPATPDEAERSPMRTSPAFLEFDRRCVALLIVLPDNISLIEKVTTAAKRPAALLVDAQGAVIRTAENVRGLLSPAAVEQMVKDELAARDEGMYRSMSEARKRAAAGEKEAAISLYRRIWDTRCLFPLAGTEAQRGLKELGVIVQEPVSTLQADPNLQIAPRKPAKP